MDPTSRCIALVEDNPADAEMLQVALQEVGIKINIVILRNGVDALEYLIGKGDSRERPCDLVILDLNLPRLSGLEVLERIRRVERLKALPIVIMSGSKNREEIERCYSLGANSYVCKSNHLAEIYTTAEKLIDFWFNCAKIPARGTGLVHR
jgi:two-component system response regulator